MTPVLLLLCLEMVNASQNLAPHTTTSEQQIRYDLSMEILRELKETSRTLGLYLNKMNAMEDKINTIEEHVESIYRQYTEEKSYSCLDLMRKNFTMNGVYTIYLHDIVQENRCASHPKQVYCDMETDGGGWLVFQRRTDGSENFYRQWLDYRNGFGDLNNEFWLGNEDLYQILNTCGNQHELRIELEDFSNEKRYAKYSTFNIGSSEDYYTLTVGGYSGNAGDAMESHNRCQFSTYDRDNDRYLSTHCAEEFKGAWWYNDCHEANLNGLYLNGTNSLYSQGINWKQWKGYEYSLKFTEMKIRPKQ